MNLLFTLLLLTQSSAPDSGVSQALARDRAARVRDLRYQVRLEIPANKAEPIIGEEVVRFRLGDASRPLVLDFAADPTGLTVEGAPAHVANGHIVLPAKSLKRGENAIHLRFQAGDASLNRNDDYLYTLFVPARASLALPVFDQPDLKAKWQLTLQLPASWQAVANGAELRRTVNGERAEVEFAESKPLPTYLFGFVAGRWKIETASRPVGDRTMTFRMYHRENDTAKIARNRDAVFDLVARSIDYMERYTGIAYPFEKYDFVAVPSFQFGGMEHAGAVLYQASTLMLDESATQNQLLGRASLIAHETAHMWFGDLVTMQWFNDVWLKEVMANFMAAKIVEPSFPEINHWLRFMLAHYPAAYDVDRTAGTHPIRQPLANLNEAAQLYGAIIYEKAPIVMAQLEALVGKDNFQQGMQTYLKSHAYGNAVFPDMIAALDPLTTENLQAWSRVWVEEAGRPTYRVDHGAIVQSDPQKRGRVWPQPISPARLADGVMLPNGDGRAYGLFDLTPTTRIWLLQNLPAMTDAVQRAAAWLDLWDALLEKQVGATDLLDLELRTLAVETDEQIASRVLAYLNETFWRYLTPEQRSQFAPRVEALLWQKVADAKTASRKATYFTTLRSVAVTPTSVSRLRAIWAQTDSIPGLKLSEDNYTSLAGGLALRGVSNGDSILDAQRARITNADRQARFDFVRPTLSRDTTVRNAWFENLRRRENRLHEPWVLEGLGNLNHPLRADEAVRYIRPALDLLAEVRATGDIFFPKRWLDATFSGHSSKEAADIVRAFLAEHPNYPVRLRQIVLQSADPVFRSAK